MIKHDEMMAENLYKVRTLAQENELVRAVISRATKKKKLDINVGVEKFNNSEDGHEGPRADGHYDIEGHQCSDVYGFTQLDLFSKKDLKLYFNNFLTWLGDVWEVFSFRYPLITLQYMWDTNPFRTTWTHWVWCVQSLSILKSDVVDAKLEEYFGSEYFSAIRQKNLLLAKKEKEFFEATGRQEMIAYANKEYLRLTPWMWVSPVDVTVIIIDEAQRPFDLKDGWSSTMITSVVWEWLQIVAGWPGAVKVDVGGIKATDTLRNELQKIVIKLKQREEKEGGNGQTQGNRDQVVSGSGETKPVHDKADSAS